MPILNLQVTMRQLGRIRMGSQVATSNGKTRPNKLETWRLTSPFRGSLEVAAELYGGTVQEWEGAPTGGQWELFTEARSLEIIIPPGDMAFSQWMEMWSGGGCVRRCDQVTEHQSGDSCICPSDPDERLALAAKGNACKPTTRLSVLQPHLPDIGLWRLETHGWYGAIELAGTMEILRQIQGGMVPAKLTIEQRQVKRDGKTNNFAVPVIELPTLTTHTLMTGEVPADELGAPQDTPAGLPADTTGVGRPQLAATPPSAPTRQPKPVPAKKAAEPVGDGAAFIRAIRGKARQLHIDDEQLESICKDIAGCKCEDVRGPEGANLVLAALVAHGAKAAAS